MWTFECSDETAATRADVWALWSVPSRWPEFDPGVQWARLEGPFEAGATITLKPKGGPKSSVKIVTAEPEQGFSSLAKLPIARLGFTHSLSDGSEGKTRITSRIEVSGPLAGLVARIFKLSRNEVVMLGNLARLAEAERPPAAVDS
jgi:hypothetical protein